MPPLEGPRYTAAEPSAADALHQNHESRTRPFIENAPYWYLPAPLL